MSLLSPDPRGLVVLHAIARTGTVSGAARDLGWSHPAVTQHVRRLEAALGCALLTRHGRGVRLTDAGRALADAGADVAAAVAAARERVADIRSQTRRVRVAAFPTACATLLVDALNALGRSGIDIRVDIHQAEPDEALAALDTGAADLAVTFSDRAPVDPRAVVLGVDSAVVVQARSEGDPARGNENLSVHELDGTAVIAGCPDCRRRFIAHSEQHGAHPVVHHQVTDDYVLMQSLAAVGQGAAILPHLAVRAHLRGDVTVRPLAPRLERHVAVWRPRGTRSIPGAEALIAELGRAAGVLLPEPPSHEEDVLRLTG